MECAQLAAALEGISGGMSVLFPEKSPQTLFPKTGMTPLLRRFRQHIKSSQS
jgi:hypothetical protein